MALVYPLPFEASGYVYYETVGFLVLSVISFGLLTLAAQKISLGTAYAVWTGIGAFGTALIGIVWFNDPATFWRVFFLIGLIGCLIGLKLVSPAEAPE